MVTVTLMVMVTVTAIVTVGLMVMVTVIMKSYIISHFHCRQESKLLIRDIQQDDLGNYGCFAENEVRTFKKLTLFMIYSSFPPILDVSEIANKMLLFTYLVEQFTQLKVLI